MLIFPAFIPFIGETESIAREKQAFHNELADPISGLITLSVHTDHDFSGYDLDAPVEDVAVTGTQGLFDTARRVANRDNLTLRDIGKWYAQGVLLPQFVGTAKQVADQIEESFTAGEADGFMVSAAQIAGHVQRLRRLGGAGAAAPRAVPHRVHRRHVARPPRPAGGDVRAPRRRESQSRADRIRSAAFSPIMTLGACVWPRMIVGMIEASATRRPSTPRTRSCGSTTLASSLPIRQVPDGVIQRVRHRRRAPARGSRRPARSRPAGRAIPPSSPRIVGDCAMRAVIRRPSISAARSAPVVVGQVPRIDDRLGQRIGRPQRDRAPAARLEQDRPHHDGVPRVRLADALVEERRGGEDQLEVRQLEVVAAADESVGLADVRGQHAAPPDEVVEQLRAASPRRTACRRRRRTRPARTGGPCRFCADLGRRDAAASMP